MPEVVGPVSMVRSTIPPVEAHCAHLRHIAAVATARRILRSKFGLSGSVLRDASSSVSAHVEQALHFHSQSLVAPQRIRPILQYYCYLNLAVAVVRAYRPPNFQQHRHHGVEDRSHSLKDLDLRSVLMVAKRGAVPLFHSLLSGEQIYGRRFRLNELAASIPLISYELESLFGAKTQAIGVDEKVIQDGKRYQSYVALRCADRNRGKARLTQARIERAMPSLRLHYQKVSTSYDSIVYHSKAGWHSQSTAIRNHRSHCLQFVNYGGHSVFLQGGLTYNPSVEYSWHGISRKPLLPTLTGALLLSFGLASIARYRPVLAKRTEGSNVNVLLDTFIGEADAIVISAMRNLLYREETYISPTIAV